MEIILDFGSGNTCKNDFDYIKKMYTELKKIDNGKYKITIKWQLFKYAGINIPLKNDCYKMAIICARECGYDVTASVFDEESLKFLINTHRELNIPIPFIKIANNPKYYYLCNLIAPLNIPIYISYNSPGIDFSGMPKNTKYFKCVSKYPALIKDYETLFLFKNKNISDHTVGFRLVKKCSPNIVEWHYKLKDSTGLDAGSWAKTPKDLKSFFK